MSVACISNGKTALFIGELPGNVFAREASIYRPDCNPQPANCLKVQNVLRHCCVDEHSGKIGNSAKFLVLTGLNAENRNIIPLLGQL